MNRDLLIEKIRKENSIEKYLYNKNILPARYSQNRKYFKCPLHKDGDPSFVLYLPSSPNDFENYFCFGCKKYGDFITIFAELDCGGDWKKALNKLSSDFKIDNESELLFIIKQITDSVLNKSNIKVNDITSEISLKISCLGYNHLVNTSFSDEEYCILENLYKVIDEKIYSENIEELEECYNFIVDNNLLGNRLTDYNIKKEKAIIEKYGKQ